VTRHEARSTEAFVYCGDYDDDDDELMNVQCMIRFITLSTSYCTAVTSLAPCLRCMVILPTQHWPYLLGQYITGCPCPPHRVDFVCYTMTWGLQHLIDSDATGVWLCAGLADLNRGDFDH